jgi:glycosyltransferase involved in cell wall biosynthesis
VSRPSTTKTQAADRPKRILILHSKYRSGPASGENRVVEDEARLLAEAGHEVTLVTPQLRSPSRVRLAAAGIRLVWSTASERRTVGLIRGLRPDVVHFHNLFPGLTPTAIRGVPDDVATIMTLHNYRLQCLPGTHFRDGRVCQDCLGRPPWPAVVHRCYQGSFAASGALASSLIVHRAVGTFDRVRRFLAISRFVKERHIAAGMSADKIEVKPHFTWPSARRTGPGHHFLYLGRLSAEKGIRPMVSSFADIPARLVIAGDGPEAELVRAAAPPNVEFTGTVPPARVAELLTGTRALVVPSAWDEPAGRVVLEAYAAGVPVLASRVGALPEFVLEGETGMLIPHNDARAWAAAFESLLDDARSTQMGDAAWAAWDREYRPAVGLRNLEAAYDGALG